MAGQKQEEGSIIAQAVIDVNTDTLISSWGLQGNLTVNVAKTEWNIFLSTDLANATQNGQHPIATWRGPAANPVRLAMPYFGVGDISSQIRVKLVDGAFAAAAGAAGDVLTITVIRVLVPQG